MSRNLRAFSKVPYQKYYIIIEIMNFNSFSRFYTMCLLRDNFEGKTVVKLEYEAYEPMAVKELNR